MNSKVLMSVALLFAGSVFASPEGHENITLGMKPSFTLRAPQEVSQSLFDFSSHFKKEVVTPTRFARFKEVVVKNPVKAGIAVAATVAVIAAVVAYAKSANEIVAEEEEVYFA